MNILIISSSMRSKSQSLKVSNYLSERVKRLNHESSVLDLHEFKLPMFDNRETVSENSVTLSEILDDADGFVFVSPEWDGIMSLGLLNMIHYAKDELAHKPVMLVGVSSGLGGAYPISQMKQMGQKNKHFVVSPENLRIAYVETNLNDDNFDDSAEDILIKKRADFALQVLIKYSEALQIVRSDKSIASREFQNGV